MKSAFYTTCDDQFRRHPLIELFHLSNLLQMLNDHSMVNVEFFSNFSCSCERITEADLTTTTTWEVARELSIDHSTIIQHLKQIGKVKKLNKWVPRELTTKKKKNLSFWSVFSRSTHWTISQFVTCDEEWILYNNQGWPAQWLDQEEAPKHYPEPDLHQKKRHGHCLVFCCWSDPL